MKTKIFSRDTNVLLQMQISYYNHWGLGYHSTIKSFTSRKRYAQKTSGCGTDTNIVFVHQFASYNSRP